MGYFKEIKLINFRNFRNYQIEFSKNCNVFFGDNGSGKTNLLESISLFGKGRGIRKDSIKNFIKKGENEFSNFSFFEDKKKLYEVKVNSEYTNNKYIKKISLNNDCAKDAIDYLYSFYSFLIFLPETERLLVSPPSFRRNFIDSFIFSKDYNYNKLINKYKRNIVERVKVLNLQNYDEVWLNKLEENISELGLKIYKSRKVQVEAIHNHISLLNNHERLPFKLTIKLNDEFNFNNLDIENYCKALKHSRHIDKITGGAKKGPHKSEYIFLVEENFMASQLSTGQQKTIILLLFLAQSNYLVKECNLNPILLMDEICSHLDDINRRLLLNIIQDFNLQIFMTGTEKNLFSFLSTNTNFCNINI